MARATEANGAASAPRPLRILMVLESDFTPHGGGGAESQLRTLAGHLKALGHTVSVVTPLLPHSPPIEVDTYNGIGIRRIRYPRWRWLGGVIMCGRFAVFLCREGRQYDVWHVHIAHHLGTVACGLGGLLRKPVFVKISGWWELEKGLVAPGGGPLRRFARACLKRATKVQAVSMRIADELRRAGFPEERIVVLPNAVDIHRFPLRPQPNRAEAPLTAVFVGRLVPEKDLETLLRAWSVAFSGRSDVRLRLVGDGPLKPVLVDTVARLGLTQQVEFLGHQDHVERILASAHIGLLPSRIEGLSNTLLEFMASGLPPVASRVSGSEDLVKPRRNGWLFPVADVGSLTACLLEADSLGKEGLSQLGRRARQDVEQAASLETVVERLLSLYRNAGPATARVV